MLASTGLIVLVTALGTGLTFFAAPRLRLEERLAIGVVVGVIAVSAAAFVGFQLFGMGWAALATAAVAGGPVAAAGWVRHWATFGREARSFRARLALPTRAGASARPFVAVTLLSAAVSTRVLSLAYQHTDQGVSAGHLSTWADWAAHLAYAGSFAYGDNRGLDLPLATGEPLRYHVLSDFFGSLFTVTGLQLTQALVWATWLVAVVIPPLLFSFVRRLTGSRLTAALAIGLFVLNGGVGAWFLADDVRADGWRTLSHLPRMYARMPDRHLWVDNTISASLYAQRSTQLGLATGLAAAVLLLAARPAWRRSGFVAAGVLVGATGIVHAHLLFTGLALGALAALADRRRAWLWFLGPAAAIGIPLAAAIRPPTNHMRWLVGWMAPQADQAWPVFWFRNIGPLLPLFALVAVLGLGSKRLRRLSAPLWLWFLVPNLIAFHPGEWNNTKFFVFWQLAGSVVVAHLLAGWLRPALRRAPAARAGTAPGRRRALVTRAAPAAVAVVLVAAMTVTGSVDTLRAMQRSSAIPWVDEGDLRTAGWLRAHAEPGDVVVYAASNTSAVAALSGRPALLMYPGWVDDLGIDGWRTRLAVTRTILAGADGAVDEARRWGVDWIAIGPRERGEMSASDDYWAVHGTLAFHAGEYRLYRVDPVRAESEQTEPAPAEGER